MNEIINNYKESLMIKKVETIKGLQTRLTKHSVELKGVNRELMELNSKKQKLLTVVSRLKNEIEDLKDKDIVISEHAILRYIENTNPEYVEEIKKEFMAHKDSIELIGNGKYPISNNMFILVRDNVIITVINKGQ